MKAVDTNVIVRVIVKDDPDQTAIAASVLAGPVSVSHCVFMEAEWVLRSRYGLSRAETAAAFRRLLDVDTVHTPEADLIRWSLDRYLEGADFADMLHIVQARGLEAFATFDGRVAAAAGPDTPAPVRRLA